ncbi:TetR/AcrR family transcriptional regulator [Cryptosporangium phraense]|uniref:TetR/AcrR family transcriptional regulator n=1 Tax=Cryptosporangium phraense TaxID=2593070 RepID=A0A545AMG6_9ACTN|nr:TetR/AcrR family transcriptional regulator [Cryptosporangium phraense]TQS42518.1 TetR/AcrR family transcriptional regulator [Cryptosporangium phraense]
MKRSGSETRAEILRIALDLFTRQGYEGTSIRDIAEALGTTKSSLYYHFANKEAIVQELVTQRRSEMDAVLAWVDEHAGEPELLRGAALRWVDSTTPQRIQALRFAHANRPVMARLTAATGAPRSWFDEVVGRILPADAPMPDRLRARMAFDTVSAALFAAHDTDATEADVLTAARAATIALTT